MRVVFTVAIVAIVATPAAFAASDFEVVRSNVPAYPAKTQLGKGTPISVPDDGEIFLIERIGGVIATRKCSGKYDGPIEKCLSKIKFDPRYSSGAPSATGAERGLRKGKDKDK